MHRLLADAPGGHHLDAFYGREPVRDDRPLTIVCGNCQAESLRVALGDDALSTVRVPPVFELDADDARRLRDWVARADVLVTQPVRDDYRGHPVGTRQLAGLLAPGARLVRFPIVRGPGLYPAHALIRPPADPSLVPPVVAYHDLRVLLRAAGRTPPRLTVAGVRAVHALGQRELRAREAAHDLVVVSDLLERPSSFSVMRTLNHPGNPVWTALAARVRAALGLPAGAPPSRPLLNAVHAPRERTVVEAFGLQDAPREHWVLDGAPVDPDDVAAAHLAFYAQRPDVVAAGLERHAATLDLLGRA